MSKDKHSNYFDPDMIYESEMAAFNALYKLEKYYKELCAYYKRLIG